MSKIYTKTMVVLSLLLATTLFVLFSCAPVSKEVPTPKVEKLTEYTLPVIMDLSGPISMLAPKVTEPRNVVIGWWNETTGKELGLKLNYKEYDDRFDPAVCASLWPQILASDKPVIVLGNGGDVVHGIGGRVADDRVPVVQYSCALTSSWKPHQWMFYNRALSTHSLGAFILWAKANLIKDRSIRVGIIASESPSGMDLVDHAQKYFEQVLTPAGKAEIVEIQYSALMPVDLTPQMQKLTAASPDFLWVGPSNTMASVLATKYMAGIDEHIPMILSQVHNNGLLSQLIGPEAAAGNYDICEYMPPVGDTTAERLYNDHKDVYGIKPIQWDDFAAQGMGQLIVVLRAIERATAIVGADNLNGQALYDALTSGQAFSNEDMLGSYQFVRFTPEETINFAGIQITTIKDGKRIFVNKDWVAVPTDVPK